MRERAQKERVKYILRGLLQSSWYGILFVLIESVAGTVTVFYKLMTDSLYYDAMSNCLAEGDLLEYLKMIGQVVPATMYISFFIIFFIMLVRTKKNQEVIYQTIDPWFVPILIGIGIILNQFIELLLLLIPESVITAYDDQFHYLDNMPILAMFLSIGILGPIMEEYFFRHLMINRLKEEKWVAIVLPALLFGIAHGNWIQSTYATLLGILFGYVYYQTQNLTYTTILHITINSSSLVLEMLSVSGRMIVCVVLLAIGGFGFMKILNKGYRKLGV